MAYLTVPSKMMGGGFENCGCFAPPGVGHGWLAITGADVAGDHVTVDGVTWKPSNDGIKFGLHRWIGVEGSQTVANRAYGFCSDDAQGTAANSGHIVRGTFNTTSKIFQWTERAVVPFGATGGGSQHPRETGRMVALDEANDALYVGTINGVYKMVISTSAVSLRALTNHEITGMILDPTDPQIMWVTCGTRGTGAGVYRVVNVRSGTVTTDFYGGINNPQDLVLANRGATRHVYVAANPGIRRWTVSADITTGWTTITNDYNDGGNGCSGIDVFPQGTGTATDWLIATNAGEANMTNAGAWSHDGGATWQNENTDWNFNDIPWGETERWWLSVGVPGMVLDNTRFDSVNPRFNPNNPQHIFITGRSGVYRTINGGLDWRPSIQGQCASVGWVVAADPLQGTRGALGDGDWTLVAATNPATTMVRQSRPQTGTCQGMMFRQDNGKLVGAFGDTQSSSQGEVWTTTNFFATTPTWADQGFGATTGATPCAGAAIGETSAGSEVLMTVQGGVLKRKVAGGGITSVQSGVGGGNGNPHFCWPGGHLGRPYVYLSTGGGLWRSSDHGANWTQIFTYTITEYTGNIHYDPSNFDTLYLTQNDGLYKVTNASGTPAKVKIGPTVNAPGPCAVDPNSGLVYLATRAENTGGTRLFVSPSNNPGTGTTFTEVTDAQWAAGPFECCDMTVLGNGNVLVATKQGGFYVSIPDGTPPDGGGGGGGGTPPPVIIDYRSSGAAFVAPNSTVTSVTGALPAGIVNGDLLIWVITGNTNVAPTTPPGWDVGPTVVNGTGGGIFTYLRIAASETASYSATVPSGRWTSQISAYLGVDTTNSQDSPATTNATSADPPGITPVTEGAWVVGVGSGRTTTAGLVGAWTSSTGTVRQNASMSTTGQNMTHGTVDHAWSGSGADDEILACNQTLSAPCSLSIALRPASGGGGGGTPAGSVAVRSASGGQSGTVLATTVSASMPAGIQAGDVAYAAVFSIEPIATATFTTPTNWTPVVAQTNNSGTGASAALYRKVLDGTETTLAVNTTGGLTRLALGIIATTGADNSAPELASAFDLGSPQSSTNTTVDAPSVSGMSGGLLLTAHGGEAATGGLQPTWTAPGGMTEQVDITTASGSGRNSAISMNSLSLASSAFTGIQTATSSTPVAQRAGISVVVKPPTTTGGGGGGTGGGGGGTIDPTKDLAPNMMTLDESNFEASKGNWQVASGGTGARSTDIAAEGLRSFKMIANSSDILWAVNDLNAAASAENVVIGEALCGSIQIQGGTTSREWRCVLRFLNADKTYNTQINGPAITCGVGTWTTIAVTGVSPIDGLCCLQMETVTTPDLNEIWYADKASITRTTTIQTWQPGSDTNVVTPAGTYTQSNVAAATTYTRIDWNVRPEVDPSPNGYFWSGQGWLLNGQAWYTGLQSAGTVPGQSSQKIALFSMWGGIAGVRNTAITNSFSASFVEGGAGWNCGIPYVWNAGSTYSMRVEKDTTRGVGWWAAYVVDPSGAQTWIGSLQAPSTYGNLDAVMLQWSEYFTNPGTFTYCTEIPRSRVFFSIPVWNTTLSPSTVGNRVDTTSCTNSSIDNVTGGVIQEMGTTIAPATPATTGIITAGYVPLQ